MWPHDMHIRRCTQRPPIRRQSSQPSLLGVTSAIWSRWLHASLMWPGATEQMHGLRARRSEERTRRSRGCQTDFDEACRREVLIERERLAQTAITHHAKAGRVDEGVGPLIVAAKPVPRRLLLLLGDAVNDQTTIVDECRDPIDER